MKNNLTERAKEVIEKIPYITLATVAKDGEPWNSPVFCAYDEDYNFYWGSYKKAKHSKNLRETGKVFLVIYDSTVPAGTGFGVYIKAQGIELDDRKEIAFAHRLLEIRHQVPYWKIEQVKDTGPIRLYKAIPEKIWVNTEGKVDGNYIDKRVEIKLT